MIEKSKAAARATDQLVHDNPWQSVGIAAAVGFSARNADPPSWLTTSGHRPEPGIVGIASAIDGDADRDFADSVEIVATEFEEERVRLRELVVFGSLTLFFVSVGLTLATLFVVALYWRPTAWPSWRCCLAVPGLGGFTAICLSRRLKSGLGYSLRPCPSWRRTGSAQSPP